MNQSNRRININEKILQYKYLLAQMVYHPGESMEKSDHMSEYQLNSIYEDMSGLSYRR